jgi:hypothetical protein
VGGKVDLDDLAMVERGPTDIIAIGRPTDRPAMSWVTKTTVLPVRC